MNHRERLAICSSCINRKLDFDFGYICQLTGSLADFKGSCKHYVRDDTVTDNLKIRTEKRPFVPLFDPPPPAADPDTKKRPAKHKGAKPGAPRPRASRPGSPRPGAPRPGSPRPGAVKQEVIKTKKLSEVARKKLRRYQSFLYALIGGLLVAAAASLGWAFAAEMTGYQGVYMALGVGLLVGIFVRFFGAGIHRIFGFLAALLTLAGSLLGYSLSQTGFPEDAALASIVTIPDYLSPEAMLATIQDSFVLLDLLFYGLAALLAYLLAIRRISKKKRAKLEDDGTKGAPALYWLRLPLILAGILLPAYYGYTLTHEDSAKNQTLYYDSGEKKSEGEMQKGLETGEWTSWYENGNIESTGYYDKGQKDSLWLWYDESGALTAKGMYNKGVENGTWMEYYPDGVVSDSGSYRNGLKEGLWKHYHENGNLMYAVNFKEGKMHGEKVLLSATGRIVKEEYYENGLLVE